MIQSNHFFFQSIPVNIIPGYCTAPCVSSEGLAEKQAGTVSYNVFTDLPEIHNCGNPASGLIDA